MHLVDPIWLDALAGTDGRLRMDELADLTARHDVVVGELLDEELRLVGPGPDPGPDPHWTPRLAELEGIARATAMDVAYRSALASGLIVETGGGEGDVSPLLSVPADAFEEAVAQLTWTHRARDAAASRQALLLRPDRQVLHDEIDVDDGTHLLVFRSAERARALVTAVLDVRADADDVDGHPEAGTSYPGGVEALLAASIVSCQLVRSPVWASTRPDRQITTHATGERDLWLLVDGEGPVRTDVPTLRRLADDLLDVTVT